MQEELLKREINKVHQFLNDNKKNDKGYYKLYNLKFANSSYNHHNLKGKNFDSDTIEESLDRLSREVAAAGPYGQRFFLFRHYSTQTDSTPIDTIFENPFYDPSTQKGGNFVQHSINGINSTHQGVNSGMNQFVFDLMKSNHESTSSLEKKITDLQHSYELEKLEDRINDLEHGSRTFVDAFKGFLESDAGATLATGLMAIVQEKILNPPQKKEPPVYQEPPPKPQQQTDYTKEQNTQIETLNNALQRLEKVFGLGGVEAIDKMSRLFESDPSLLEEFLSKHKEKRSTNEQF